MAAFQGMHVSPAKHDCQESVATGQTDRQTPNKVIPLCRYASQATQKYCNRLSGAFFANNTITFINDKKLPLPSIYKVLLLLSPPFSSWNAKEVYKEGKTSRRYLNHLCDGLIQVWNVQTRWLQYICLWRKVVIFLSEVWLYCRKQNKSNPNAAYLTLNEQNNCSSKGPWQ